MLTVCLAVDGDFLVLIGCYPDVVAHFSVHDLIRKKHLSLLHLIVADINIPKITPVLYLH